jgi:TonB family protein
LISVEFKQIALYNNHNISAITTTQVRYTSSNKALNSSYKKNYFEIDIYISGGIFVSLLLHILILFYIHQPSPSLLNKQNIIDVSIIPVAKKPAVEQSTTQQIVSKPDTTEQEKENNLPKFLSDSDNNTNKQQIKRGDDEKAATVLARSKMAERSNPNKNNAATMETKQVSNEPKPLKHLRLDENTLLDKFAITEKKLPQPNKQSDLSPTASYQAFSRPHGSGAAILGITGSNDYLPHLPDGDITFLNTKASLHAVFVRRVATQVFSEMRKVGWEGLRSGDINSIDSYCTVHAILSAEGKLLSVKSEETSGSTRFDGVLLKAVSNAARDPNPPKGALAEDGNIHFIFKSKSWSRFANNARTGAPFEQRWLLLSTGLL